VTGLENNLQEFFISRRAAHVLRRAVPFAGKAHWAQGRMRSRQNLLQHDLMSPVVAQVVDVEHRITLCLHDCADFRPALVDDVDVHLFVMLRHAPILAVFFKLMKMAIGPAHDCLEDIVETTQPEGARDLNQSPDRRTNLLQGDPELVNTGGGLHFNVISTIADWSSGAK
jgi:hypothetical protein